MPPYFSVLILFLLAWGAFAFGAVYDWAYTPLFWSAAAIGALGWLAPGSASKPRTPWAMALPLAVLAVGVGFQLIPLPLDLLAGISPATDRFLARYDVAYAAARTLPAFTHPLSIDPAGTRLALCAMVALGLLLVGSARGLGSQGLRTLAGGLVAIGAALALAGIVQFGLSFHGNERTSLVYGFWKPIQGTSPFGPFINRNHFAGWMLLVLPIGCAYFATLVTRGLRHARPSWRERALWFSSAEGSRAILVGLAVILMGSALVLTLSRSGISGFLLAVAVAAVLIARRRGARARRGAGVFGLGVLVAVSVVWVGSDAIVARFSDPNALDLNGRFAIWADAQEIVCDFPLTGTGLNTFGTSMVTYQRKDLDTRAFAAHNDYLQLASEGGLLLGIPAVALLVLLIREIRGRFRDGADDEMEYWIRVGATTGLAAIALQETVEFSLQIPGNAALFAVIAAMAIRPGLGRNSWSEEAVRTAA